MNINEIKGVIPPATTPFDKSGNIDFGAIKSQIDWLCSFNIGAIAVGGSTGEGHTLNREEYKNLISEAVNCTKQNIPIIAGVITDSTQESILRGNLVKDMGVAALQVTPVHYLFRPDDEAMVQHFKSLADGTGLPIIIYNVIPWTYLSPQLLVRIMDEVPLVVGVKQSAGDMKLFADLMIMAKPEYQIYSAVDALLYSSYTLGAYGSIAAILTAAPGPSVDLWDAVKNGDHNVARNLHEKLLRLWNAMSHENLPACVKYAQKIQGVNSGFSREPMPMPGKNVQLEIEKALLGLGIS